MAGWAARGATPVTLIVRLDGQEIARFAADRPRADLAGIDGAGAFELWFPTAPPAAASVRIAVQAEDGSHLPGSPALLPRCAPIAPTRRLPNTGGPIALVVDMAAPDPVRDPASAALLSHMHALRRLGYLVVFSTLAEADDAIRRMAGRVRLGYLRGLRPMALLAERLRAANPGVHVVFAVAALAHVRAEREAALLGIISPIGLREAELSAARAADAMVTHSPAEAALLERTLPGLRVHWVPWTMAPRPVDVPFAERARIGYCGNAADGQDFDAIIERTLTWALARG